MQILYLFLKGNITDIMSPVIDCLKELDSRYGNQNQDVITIHYFLHKNTLIENSMRF